MTEILLIIFALLPAILLCRYVYKMDRVEKEPLSLLLKLFLYGVISCIPAASIENMLFDVINSVFGRCNIYILNFMLYFVGVALVEEGVKWFFMTKFTNNNQEFDCLYDGLIYAVFVSLGFASFENILYVFEGGIAVAIGRALLSVPTHMFVAVMMGYYYSMWKITDKAADTEKRYVAMGMIELKDGGFDSSGHKFNSLIVPVLAHGFYDFCCSVDAWWGIFVLIGFVIFMYIYCFKKIKNMSFNDQSTREYATRMVVDKYPHLERKVYIW